MAHKGHFPPLKDPEAALYIRMSESWLLQSRMRGNPEAPPYIKIDPADPSFTRGKRLLVIRY